MSVRLEFCARTDTRYVSFRDRHYVPNKGSHGQQVHFLIRANEEVVGVISGGSSVYSVRSRDLFFGIPSNRHDREKLWLPSIVNNTVFRLEEQAGIKNLGTQVLRVWRNAVSDVWEQMYGVPVLGFETFVVPSASRTGAMYRADNWTDVGITAGRSKQHATAGGLSDKRSHVDTEKKIILTRWAKGRPLAPTIEYVSCWKRTTDIEKEKARELTRVRRELTGCMFDSKGRL